MRPRAKAHQRARQGGMHVPEQCQCEGEASQSMVGVKGRGRRRVAEEGDGEAREHDLESFVASVTRHKVNRGNFPKSATSLTHDSAWSTVYHIGHFSHSSPPHQQQLFPKQRTSNGKVLFFLLSPDRYPFLTGPTGAPSCASVSGESRARRPCCTWFVFCVFSFSFSPLTALFLHRCTRTPSRSQPLGGLPFSRFCACCTFLLTNTRCNAAATWCVFFLSFSFPFSFTDFPFFSHLPPARPFATRRVTPRVPRPQASSVTRRVLLPPLALGHPPFPAWAWDVT